MQIFYTDISELKEKEQKMEGCIFSYSCGEKKKRCCKKYKKKGKSHCKKCPVQA